MRLTYYSPEIIRCSIGQKALLNTWAKYKYIWSEEANRNAIKRLMIFSGINHLQSQKEMSTFTAQEYATAIALYSYS